VIKMRFITTLWWSPIHIGLHTHIACNLLYFDLTYTVNNTIKYSSWGAESCTSRQRASLKFHSHGHQWPPLDPVPTQLKWVSTQISPSLRFILIHIPKDFCLLNFF
jgi:hypothetical protein